MEMERLSTMVDVQIRPIDPAEVPETVDDCYPPSGPLLF
jgi:hypothetical protein